MGLIITPQVKIDEYYESKDLNQSSLKHLAIGLDSFLENNKDKPFIKKEYFTVGSAVDCLLTGNVEDFKNKYHISSLNKKLSETETNIIETVYSFAKEQENVSTLDVLGTSLLQDAILHHNWQSNWKIETRIRNMVETGKEYFEELKLSDGKQMLTTTQYDLINRIKTSLETHPRTSNFFNRSLIQASHNVTIYYQLPIYFKYKKIDCKALLDILIVETNSNNEVVKIRAIDLKTMSGNCLEFPRSLYTYGYNIQAAWYLEAVKTLYPNVEATFSFIVESTTNPGNPLIYNLFESLLKQTLNGREAIYSSNILLKPAIKGINDLINDYLYYQENGWEEDKRIRESGGILSLDCEGIV